MSRSQSPVRALSPVGATTAEKQCGDGNDCGHTLPLPIRDRTAADRRLRARVVIIPVGSSFSREPAITTVAPDGSDRWTASGLAIVL